MLGVLRFLLALGVVVAHLVEQPFVSHWGTFSVFGFYLLSGYLITFVLNETYAFQAGPFFLNRILKLYPPYLMVAGLTLAAFAILPNAAQFHPSWVPSHRLIDLAGNTLIVPFEFYDRSFRIVPPTWSLAVELINYSLLFAVIGRSLLASQLTVVASMIFHAVSLSRGEIWSDRYMPFYAALLPFAFGAMIYFQRPAIARLTPRTANVLFAGLASVWLVNLIVAGIPGGLNGQHYDAFFYANLILLAGLVAVLTHPSAIAVPKWIGKQLGDLAYPMFLSHWLSGFLISSLVLGGEKRGLLLFALSLPLVLTLSWLITSASSRPLERHRDRVRNSALRSPAPSAVAAPSPAA